MKSSIRMLHLTSVAREDRLPALPADVENVQVTFRDAHGDVWVQSFTASDTVAAGVVQVWPGRAS